MSNENLELKKLLNLAIQNHQNNNYAEAFKIYEKILKIKPDHFETNFYLGTLHAQNNNLKKAYAKLHISNAENKNIFFGRIKAFTNVLPLKKTIHQLDNLQIKGCTERV